MISVIIPLYNKADTIARAIQSVLNQTYQDFELIVVDDGSTDNGTAIVQAIDDRIRIVNQENQGVSAARNRGIKEAKSDLIAFLDSDDEWLPDFLETVSNLYNTHPQCAVCATAYLRVDAHRHQTAIHLSGIPQHQNFILENYFEVASKSDPPFCSISIMVHKEALLSIGGFPEGVHQGEDLLTWARLAAQYQIAYCREPHSLFYTGVSCNMDTPKRLPDTADPVGKALETIYHQHPAKGLRQYISHWHKMRASMYMRMPHSTRACRNEIRIANQWSNNRKLTLYRLLLFLPYSIRIQLLKRL